MHIYICICVFIYICRERKSERVSEGASERESERDRECEREKSIYTYQYIDMPLFFGNFSAFRFCEHKRCAS